MAVRDEDAASIERAAPGGVGLLVVDMINHLDFPGAETLRDAAERAAEVVLTLRDQADRLGVPVIYINDNFGEWHADQAGIVEATLGKQTPGRDMVLRLRPRPRDFFVIKPHFSGFYSTNLPVLLPRLGVDRVVLTGIAADICVLFTAADAHMREYGLWVPADAVAGEAGDRTAWALDIMNKSMGADTRATTELSLDAWIGEAARKAA